MHEQFEHYSDKVDAPDPYDIESCLVSDAQCALEAADFDDYVQVGCHRIPVANLNAIYEEEIQ